MIKTSILAFYITSFAFFADGLFETEHDLHHDEEMIVLSSEVELRHFRKKKQYVFVKWV